MSEVHAGNPPESPGLSATQARLLLLSIVAIGLAWRCYAVASRCLWFDEALPYFICRLPLPELMERVYYAVHPPLYYLLLKGWMYLFGTSPVALRAPTFLSGTLAIVGVYLFTVEALRRPLGADGARPAPNPRAREIGIWAAALVALSVAQIRWSWDVRPYGIGVALVAFSSWALFRALRASSARYGYWLLFALLSLVFVYMHYLALLTIAAQGLFVLGWIFVQALGDKRTAAPPRGTPSSIVTRVVRHPQFMPAVLAAVIFCLGFLPWLPAFIHQRHRVQEIPWIAPASWTMAGGYAFHLMIQPECLPTLEATEVAVVCVILCLTLPLGLLWQSRAVDWYVALCALIPIALAVLASTQFNVLIFYSRYLLFAHLFILMSAALLLGRIRLLWARLVTGALVVLVMFGLDVRYIQELDLDNTPSCRGVVDYVERQRQPGEPVIVCDQLYYLPLRSQCADAPGWYLFGHNADPTVDAWEAFGEQHVKRQKDLHKIAEGHVWIVNVTIEDDGSTCNIPVPERWEIRSVEKFADRYGLIRTIEVVEYRVPAPARARQCQ